MTVTTKTTIQISVVLLLTLCWLAIPAYATGKKDSDIEQDQHQGQQQGQGQHQGQGQGQAQLAEGGAATASMDGIDVDASDHSNTENNSTNVVLVPNNNTESCLRVWGIAFGNDGTSGGIGIPWRSKKCDYEQAADDAFAAGERELGWFWKCENPNLYKSFKSKEESNESAKTDCLTKMVGGVTATTTITTLTEEVEELLAANQRQQRRFEQQLIDQNERMKSICDEQTGRAFEACQTK